MAMSVKPLPSAVFGRRQAKLDAAAVSEVRQSAGEARDAHSAEAEDGEAEKGPCLFQGSLKDTFCNHWKHGFFHQNKGKPEFTRQCSGV